MPLDMTIDSLSALRERIDKTCSNTVKDWTHERFERLYGVEKAALLRGLLAEIYSDEFADAFAAESAV